VSVDTGEAPRPESPPPDKQRPLVGPLLFFVAVMAVIVQLPLVVVILIVITGLIIRAVRRHRHAGDDE
jgi:Flp pilus assembly protein TadB